MVKLISHSADETEQIGEKIAKKLHGTEVIALFGGLGMGKTAFTTGFVKGLGINADVSSPTFAICNDYIGENARAYHFDMYRVESWDDLYSTGFFDYLETDAYILAEWSENIFGALPDDAIIIEIKKIDENTRKFIFKSKSDYIED